MKLRNFLLTLFICHFSNAIFSTPTHPKNEYQSNTVLVKYRSHINKDIKNQIKAASGLDATVKTFLSLPSLEVVRLRSDITVPQAIAQLKKNKNVLYAEPNYIIHALKLPNDVDLDKLWGLHNEGQDGGTAGYDMNMPAAWELTTGSKNAVVATIDTGVDYTHPDLIANLWEDDTQTNQKFGGCNTLDNNGDPMDDNGHGTHVAGTIAAAGNNEIGVVGINWSARILACKFLDKEGSGSLEGAISAMDYIYSLKTRPQDPVNIVATNNSYGWSGDYSQAFADAIAKQKEAGILFIAAAGNEGANNDITGSYPANFPIDNVISVAAMDKNGNLPEWTNTGSHSVHVAAPGVDIYSTYMGGGYETLSGTSMATPHVVGLAALISAYDNTLNYRQIRNLIISSGSISEQLNNKVISGRFVRASGEGGVGALTCNDQVVSQLIAPHSQQIISYTDEEIPVSFYYINCKDAGGSDSLTIQLGDDNDTSVELTNNGAGLYEGKIPQLPSGQYNVQLPHNTTLRILVLDKNKEYKAEEVESDYIDIDGESLPVEDDLVTSLKAPFPIQFAEEGVTFDTLDISTNGLISLSGPFSSPTNDKLPTSLFDGALIAPYWDDLVPSHNNKKDSQLSYAVIGEEPERQLVIEWKNFSRFSAQAACSRLLFTCPNRTPLLTFQVVFSESSPEIQFNYQSTEVGNPDFDNGKSASVGVQIASGIGTNYSFMESKLHQDTSLLFELQNCDDGNDSGDDDTGRLGDPSAVPPTGPSHSPVDSPVAPSNPADNGPKASNPPTTGNDASNSVFMDNSSENNAHPAASCHAVRNSSAPTLLGQLLETLLPFLGVYWMRRRASSAP